METWYYWADNQEFGPVTKLDLYKLFKANVIAGYSFVRPHTPQTQDSDTWRAYKELGIRRSDFTWEELNGAELKKEELSGDALTDDDAKQTLTSEAVSADAYKSRFKGVWSDFSPHPWRRYFARWIDISIYANLIFSPALAKFTPGDMNNYIGQLSLVELIGILVFLPMVFFGFVALVNITLIGLFGTTTGKYLLGVKILTKDDLPLSMKQAAKRETLVYVKGFALGLPVLSLIAQMYGYFDLTMDKVTSWDKDLNTTIVQRDNNGLQFWICLIVIGLYLYFSRSPYSPYIAWF